MLLEVTQAELTSIHFQISKIIILDIQKRICDIWKWILFLLSFTAYSAGALLCPLRRHSSCIAAFLQADAMPMFCWPRSASTARSHVWLGLPDGRFQSGGSPRITAATARWWSSCGELRVVQRAASVCQWPGGREDGIRWLLWLPNSYFGYPKYFTH